MIKSICVIFGPFCGVFDLSRFCGVFDFGWFLCFMCFYVFMVICVFSKNVFSSDISKNVFFHFGSFLFVGRKSCFAFSVSRFWDTFGVKFIDKFIDF
jgi:hypothetical protein